MFPTYFILLCIIYKTWASLIAQLIKNPPAMQETLVRFLGQEDPLEKEIAAHSSSPDWRIQWTEYLGRLQSMGLQSFVKRTLWSQQKLF